MYHIYKVCVMLYPTILCIIIKTNCTVCAKNFTSGTQHLTQNTTDLKEHTAKTPYTTNSFETTPRGLDQNSSIDVKEPENLERIYSSWIRVQDMFVIPVVCPIGIIGNGLVAHNLFSKRKLNSSFTYMVFILLADILSLVSDLFIPLARILLSSASISTKQMASNIIYWNGDILSMLFRRFSLNVFCVLSFERLTAIKHPLKLYRAITVTRPYIFIILSLVISVVATLYTPLFLKMEQVNDKESNKTQFIHGYSDLYKSYEQYFSVFVTITRFFDGPTQIVFFTIINGMIVHGLYENKKSVALVSNSNRNKSISKLQTRLVKIFLILSFTNMIAFLPTPVIVIISKLFPETGLNVKSTKMKIIMFGGNFIRVINSLTDFIVFLVISKDIREEIYRKMTCKKERNGNNRCTTHTTSEHIS